MSTEDKFSKYKRSSEEKSEDGKFSKYKRTSDFKRGLSIAAAPVKGALKNYESATLPWQPSGPVNSSLAKRVLDKFLTTQDKPLEQVLERAGGLVPAAALGGEGLGAKALQVGAGTVAGELAKAMGAEDTGQGIAEAVGMGIPGVVGGIKRGISSAFSKPKATLPSGITKSNAVNSPKMSKLALMSDKRQKAVVEKLNKEAAELTAKSVKTHLPISEQIKQGVDFDSIFNKNFAQIEAQANKANPQINVTALSDFMDDATKKFAGLPKGLLSKDLKNIASDVNEFRKNPITSLKKLLKIFRINNDKRTQIYETALVKGKQRKYLNFLSEFNKSISQSIQNTLPKDSPWVKSFLENNQQFSNYLNAKKTEKLLQPFLGGKPTPQKIEALISNPEVKKRLALSMGDKGAQEISEIAKDLKTSTEAIKNIPKGSLDKFDAIFPLYFLIPWVGKYLGVYKALQAGRHAYGWLLSRPESRKWVREGLKAISSQDLEGYKKASVHLINEINKRRLV